MSRKTKRAGAIALASMIGFITFGAATTGVSAQDEILSDPSEVAAGQEPASEATATPAVRFVSQEVVQPLDQSSGQFEHSHVAGSAESLAQLVASVEIGEELSSDMHCLAGAIYFESRGEPLEGQLAVARVIVNRAESDRFPSSYCGVVYQRSQFSFVRGGKMPAINTSSAAWAKARAIARIAHEGLWDSAAKGALFFHATSVRPNWRLTRVGQVHRHIFYR
ncbi:MAG TPA: cell wall hydrolase [Sphingomonadaceae bacterium]|nr:cell wall hydrolase [Sphingomonadaceae bacterium]